MVGGTNYYIESLLWKILVTSDPQYKQVCWPTEDSESSSDDDEVKDSEPTSTASDVEKQTSTDDILKMTVLEMDKIESNELHMHLAIHDPTSANRIHPNNKRKIIR